MQQWCEQNFFKPYRNQNVFWKPRFFSRPKRRLFKNKIFQDQDQCRSYESVFATVWYAEFLS